MRPRNDEFNRHFVAHQRQPFIPGFRAVAQPGNPSRLPANAAARSETPLAATSRLDESSLNGSNTRPFAAAFSAPACKHKGRVAQLVEQGIENPRVGGSIPSSATIPFKFPQLFRPRVIPLAMGIEPHDARFDDARLAGAYPFGCFRQSGEGHWIAIAVGRYS